MNRIHTHNELSVPSVTTSLGRIPTHNESSVPSVTTSLGRIPTKYYSKVFEELEARSFYEYLRTAIDWEDSIITKKSGYTRKGKLLDINEDELVTEIIARAFSAVQLPDVVPQNIYLNYYCNGEDYSPRHAHPKQCQVIISLGATRKLTMGNGSYDMSNGDVIVFGSSLHGVPKQPAVREGRIAIAVFAVPRRSIDLRDANPARICLPRAEYEKHKRNEEKEVIVIDDDKYGFEDIPKYKIDPYELMLALQMD